MTWWCFDRPKLREALDVYLGEEKNPHGALEIFEVQAIALEIEKFLYSDQMKRLGNCRDDDGGRDFGDVTALPSPPADEGPDGAEAVAGQAAAQLA